MSAWPTTNAAELRPELTAELATLVAASASKLPPRLEALLVARFAKLRGLDEPDDPAGVRTGPMTTAESAVIDFAERFMLDIRGVTPAVIDDLLLAHYDQDTASAILFRIALLEGMTKFERIFPGGSPPCPV